MSNPDDAMEASREHIFDVWAGLDPDQEAEIEHLVQQGVGSYPDALYRVTGRRVLEKELEGEPEVEANGQMRLLPSVPRRFERPPRPPLSAREKAMADKRPDLKPGNIVLNSVDSSALPEQPMPQSTEPSPADLERQAYDAVSAYYGEPVPPWMRNL